MVLRSCNIVRYIYTHINIYQCASQQILPFRRMNEIAMGKVS